MDPFVGRARERRQVTDSWATLAAGRGSLFVVSGEAGIGKTRFCAEVADRARHAGLTVVTARCWADGGAPALWPWQLVMRELCGREGSGLVSFDAEPAASPDRFERFAGVVDCFAAAGAERPVCLVVDDVHAADAGTLQLLRYVAQSLDRLPVSMVLSRRTGEPTDRQLEARVLQAIEREATAVTLPAFDLDDTTAFLATHGLPDLESGLGRALFRLTGGNPLLLRDVAARGAREPARGPSTLRIAVEHVVGRLDAEDRRVVLASAVLGLEVSIREATAVARADPIVVLDAVARAEAAGLVDTVGPERFTFSHELVRAALEGCLPTGDRLDAHARAAAAVAGGGADARPSRLARRAHHALHAAARSVDDAGLAVAACRDAARSMIRSLAYDRADALLSAAVGLHEPASLGDPPADLLVQWAQAALHRGLLAEARQRFDRAASAAEHEGDRVMLAEAALGSGGPWVHDRRMPDERRSVLDRQGKAQVTLPDEPAEHRALGCRLRTRIAAEATFDGGPLEPLLHALDDARRCGDPRTHGEALQLTQHALFWPEHNRFRLTLSDEQLRVAAESGDGLQALMGLYWRAVNLFHLGNRRSLRALEDLRERANALGHQEMLYLVAVVDVMLLIRQGRLTEAEGEADRCAELGEAIGAPDTVGYWGGHVVVIRWAQGREAEMLDLVEHAANSPTRVASDFSFPAIAAAVAGRDGQLDRARAGLDQLTAEGLDGLRRSSTWLAGMTAIAEAAAALGDEAVARAVHKLMEPFAGLPTIVSGAVLCLGSTRRPLGLAAATFGDLDQAVAHLDQAVADSHRFGNRPFATIARADLATVLARRGRPDDRARAGDLLRRAVAEADDMGMTARADTWRADLAALRRDRPSRPATTDEPAERGRVRRMGPSWLIEVADASVVVPDLLGIRYLAELLTSPGEPIPALSLVGGPRLPTGPAGHDLIDAQARETYGARLRALAHELDECEADNDIGRAERIRDERDALLAELERAAGLGNRPRTFTDDPERARTAVRKAIRRAIDAIDRDAPGIAQHLRDYVVTGASCSYVPPPGAAIAWSAHL